MATMEPPTTDTEFEAMWDAQMLQYPTITRSEAGEWNYFNILPEQPEMIYEDGRRRPLDGAAAHTLQWNQGEMLAHKTLALTSRYYEADSCALTLIMSAAHKALDDPERAVVAKGFISEILYAAVRGREPA